MGSGFPSDETALVAEPGSAVGKWDPGSWFTLSGSSIALGGKGCKQQHWAITPEPASGVGSDWDATYLGVFNLDIIVDYLRSLVATPNTRMALIETNGLMLASNSANMHLNEFGNSSVTLDLSRNSLLASVAGELVSAYGSYANVPHTISLRYKSPDDGYAFLDVVRITDKAGLDVLAILVVPEDDLLSKMKKTRKTAAIVVSVIACVTMVIAGISSYLFTISIMRLSAIMLAATNFDFSSVRDKDRAEQRSVLREIAIMEEVFMTMLKKFAGAIEANRKLITRTEKGSSSGSHMGPSSTEPTSSSPV
ncbi:hypothetical protein HDU90_008669 [Geranomyces variabilis]|nr:hypothetical protein HDU90_008669 [Geranomyces variabilis]